MGAIFSLRIEYKNKFILSPEGHIDERIDLFLYEEGSICPRWIMKACAMGEAVFSPASMVGENIYAKHHVKGLLEQNLLARAAE